MKHFSIHRLSKTQPSLLPKVSDKLRCGNMDSAVYFYHSDHLGSASWITNGNGTPIQHLQYMPYGEPFVNERISSYNERFTFTGKERDSETGYSYFGARFYDSDLMTGWLSIDPMADKFPNISPYNYCNWNPVIIKDPNGEKGVKVVDTKSKTITVKATYYVVSNPKLNRDNTFYTEEEINSMNTEINSTLNTQGYTYEFDGEMYNVRFDLEFISAGDYINAFSLKNEDSYGNCFSRMPEKLAPNIFPVIDNNDGTVTHTAGVHQNDEIIMNANYGDNNRNRIHEIFHSLYFNNDNADSGIGNYSPGTDLPNQADINKLLTNPDLREEIK